MRFCIWLLLRLLLALSPHGLPLLTLRSGVQHHPKPALLHWNGQHENRFGIVRFNDKVTSKSRIDHDCLTDEGFQHQCFLEDRVKTPSSGLKHRHILQSYGTAGSVAPSPDNVSNASSTWEISLGPETAQVPSTSVSATRAAIVSPSLSPSPSDILQQPSSSVTSKQIVVLVAVPCSLVLFLVVGCILLFFYHRCNRTPGKPWKGNTTFEPQKGCVRGVPEFSRLELQAACEDFSNIIGCSPDTVLFKGTFANGIEIAVTSIRKSAESWSSNLELLFWRRVEYISRMKHQNLVNLLGYCAEEEPFVRMLVFEYVPNGTLFEHLQNEESEPLDWTTRMRIIVGVAYALDYIHHCLDSPTPTKLDAKAVYLTEEYTAKLADFGVWNVSTMQDSNFYGEPSYTLGDDEWQLLDWPVPDSERHILSFGKFLVEIIAGRQCYCQEFASPLDWAMHFFKEPGQIAHIVDPMLQTYNCEELEVIGNVALQCLQPDSLKMLTMKQITAHLTSSLQSLNEPVVSKSSPLMWAQLEILSQD